MAFIEPQTLQEYLDAYLAVLLAESGRPLGVEVGSVLRAIGQAGSLNDSYLQAQIVNLDLNSRLDTAESDALDNLVNQYVPPFTARQAATAPSSGPLTPTTLTANATATYLLVNNIFGFVATQTLRLYRLTFSATTSVNTVEPTTLTATTTVTNGTTVINVVSTAGMFVGAPLRISDGTYSAEVTITAVPTGTQVLVTPVTVPSNYTWAVGSTIKLLRVLKINALVFGGGTLLTDLIVGTSVKATSFIEGVRFFANAPVGSDVLIPVGTVVTSATTGIPYTVVADVANPDYYAGVTSYKILTGQSEVYVKVQAQNTGTSQRVLANTLTVLPAPIVGVDGTTNPYAIQNGSDEETDDDLRTRFRDFIAGRQSGTRAAIEAAIREAVPGLQFRLTENVGSDGVTFTPGNFLVVAADDNGLLSTDDYNALFTAVDAARAFTVTFLIKAPTLLTPTFVVVLEYATGADHAAVASEVKTALYNSIHALPAGSEFFFNSIIDIAMDVVGVQDVVYATINGNGYDKTGPSFVLVGTGPADIVAGAFEFIRPPLGNISVT
jgi:hypothetical protein